MSAYWKRQFSGPLAGHAKDLRAEFSTLGYARSTATSHLALWAQVSRWLEDQSLTASKLSPDRIGEFLQLRGRTYGLQYSIKALSPGLELLRRMGAVPDVQAMVQESAVGAIERQFRNYLQLERGLAEVSAQTYVIRARPFLIDRARRGALELGSLTAADVSGFVAGWLPGLSKAPARSTVTALRSLLSFLHASVDHPSTGIGRPDGGVVETDRAPDRSASRPDAGPPGRL
jgi:hypothetical protein